MATSFDPFHFSLGKHHDHPLVLGIDFGTCRTSAAVLIGDDIHPVRLGANRYDEGKDMPTAVFVDGDGQFLVGEDAVRSALRDPSSFVKEFKLRIGGLAHRRGLHQNRLFKPPYGA